MKPGFLIKPLEKVDLPILPDFQPPKWNDISLVFQTHIEQPYFYAVVATLNEKPVCIGELILTGDNAWIGNIISKPNYRKQGFGSAVSQHLLELAKKLNAKSIYLLATPEGKPLYEKLAFTSKGKYLFYKKTAEINSVSPDQDAAIVPYNAYFLKQIFTLDRQASGEDRSRILENFTSNCFVYLNPDKENDLLGFYMPDLGDGLLIASTHQAAVALLHFRNRPQVVLPEDNKAGNELLRCWQFEMYRTATLMVNGAFKKWEPSMIYSRIGGYLG